MQSLNNRLTLKERLHPSRFIKGEKATKQPITLNHRQIFILPSGQGLLFAITLTPMLVLSLNYNISLGFMLTFLLGSLSVISIFHCFKNLAGLNFQLKPIEPVFAGAATNVTVQLFNPSYARWGIVLSKGRNNKQTIKKNIPKGEAALFSFSIEGVGRGCHSVGTLTVFTVFPLGLFAVGHQLIASRNFLFTQNLQKL